MLHIFPLIEHSILAKINKNIQKIFTLSNNEKYRFILNDIFFFIYLLQVYLEMFY